MKKLKLNALELGAMVLTREQLRNVVGGSEGDYCSTDEACGSLPSWKCINNKCTVVGFGNPCVPECYAGWSYCVNGTCWYY